MPLIPQMHGTIILKSLILTVTLYTVAWRNVHHFTDDIYKLICLSEKFVICQNSLISLADPTNKKLTLVKVMARSWTGDKPSPEPMMTRLTCVYLRHQASVCWYLWIIYRRFSVKRTYPSAHASKGVTTALYQHNVTQYAHLHCTFGETVLILTQNTL